MNWDDDIFVEQRPDRSCSRNWIIVGFVVFIVLTITGGVLLVLWTYDKL